VSVFLFTCYLYFLAFVTAPQAIASSRRSFGSRTPDRAANQSELNWHAHATHIPRFYGIPCRTSDQQPVALPLALPLPNSLHRHCIPRSQDVFYLAIFTYHCIASGPRDSLCIGRLSVSITWIACSSVSPDSFLGLPSYYRQLKELPLVCNNWTIDRDSSPFLLLHLYQHHTERLKGSPPKRTP